MTSVNSVTRPYCVVDFHTSTNLYSAKGTHQPTDDLIAVSTSKSLASPTGTWSLTLVPRVGSDGKTWYQRLKPMDLVVIQMGRPPEAQLGTVMVGLIDTVRKSRTVGEDGKVSVRIAVTGRDFGKVLLKAIIKWFPQFAENEFPIKELGGSVESVFQMLQFYVKHAYQVGSPATLIKNTIENIITAIMCFEIKYWQNNKESVATLKEILQFRLGMTGNIIPFWTTMSTFEGSLWNFITTVQNAPFNEIFLDVLPTDITEKTLPSSKVEHTSKGIGDYEATFGADNSKITLFLRPTPFDEADWKALPVLEITDARDIISDDLGVSDHDNFNIFQARPKYSVLDDVVYDIYVTPKFNADNIKKHGISYYQTEVEGIYDGKQVTESLVSSGELLTDKLKKWYEKNIEYENGNVNIKGNSKARIGQRLRNLDTEMEYYIESVSNEFQNFGEWKSMLSVTRGQPMKSSTVATPITTATVVTTPVIQTKTATIEPVYYDVIKGDSLWKIAVKFYQVGNEWGKIAKANPQVKAPDYVIYPGQRLIIP